MDLVSGILAFGVIATAVANILTVLSKRNTADAATLRAVVEAELAVLAQLQQRRTELAEQMKAIRAAKDQLDD
ncbi:MAG: hypothetical protein OXF41_06335 [bacterium]|nr:hypothetical protein [bacterium]